MKNEMTIAGVTLHFDDEGREIKIEDNIPYWFENAHIVNYLVDVVQEIVQHKDLPENINYETGFIVVEEEYELYNRAYDFGRDARIAYEFIQEFFATKDKLEDEFEDDAE